MSNKETSLSAPRRANMLLEARSALDMARMVGPLVRAQLGRAASRDDLHVIVVPGFGADDYSTAPLRHYLTRRGFAAEGWGLGRNLAGTNLPHSLEDLSPLWELDAARKADYRGEAGVPYLCDRLTDRVRERHADIGKPLALIGWSLGGYLAREAARDLPNAVDRVITMGSPIVGGPRYTAAARFFEKREMDLDWIEEEIQRREARPIRQPITAIYSKTDAVVHWHATVDRFSEDVRHVEVNAAHLGMGFNPTIWRHVLDALEPEAANGVT
jgi:pimeloyl-ACP methyl ester carboxylesterase